MDFLVITEFDKREPDHRIEGPFPDLESARQALYADAEPNQLGRLLCAVLDATDTRVSEQRGKPRKGHRHDCRA